MGSLEAAAPAAAPPTAPKAAAGAAPFMAFPRAAMSGMNCVIGLRLKRGAVAVVLVDATLCERFNPSM